MRLEQSSFIPFCPVGPVRASQFWFVSFAGHIREYSRGGEAVEHGGDGGKLFRSFAISLKRFFLLRKVRSDGAGGQI
jgi:hypothetical protein